MTFNIPYPHFYVSNVMVIVLMHMLFYSLSHAHIYMCYIYIYVCSGNNAKVLFQCNWPFKCSLSIGAYKHIHPNRCKTIFPKVPFYIPGCFLFFCHGWTQHTSLLSFHCLTGDVPFNIPGCFLFSDYIFFKTMNYVSDCRYFFYQSYRSVGYPSEWWARESCQQVEA